ncbi:dymeclin-like [Dreissena polymorpha]|uniref:Dymeclin n=1 Tax=Dreissena polymorpha TaxID=45954 RepID=A0A9D4DC65_DREPO|nr:dymeclin-like [Dreissena polymorpha]XP_052237428.1 dymeclin-like [Dreissena polymorpha]KAH3746684.1 hypothetical protein DPMN_181094 [Dreissena polymorpha]
MGANSSSFSDLATNQYLIRFASSEAISVQDPFWNQLLSYTFLIPINSSDGKLLEESTSLTCKNLAINNCKTGNFGSLVRTFLIRCTELKASAQCEDNIFTWQTYNALFIIRSVCKYLVEHLSEDLLVQQFDAKPAKQEGSEEDSIPLGEQLMTALVELLVDVPVLSFTYALHLEALNTLIVLLSVQMYQPLPASRFTMYKYMMQGKCSIHACLLVKALLRNYVNQEKCPHELYKNTTDSVGAIANMTASLASSLWSVVTLGMGSSASASATKKTEEEFNETLLANQSLLFLLVLANHCTSELALKNPYRQALFQFTNAQEAAQGPTTAHATFKTDFSELYKTLCSTLKDDQTTLLLYLLIHRNPNVKAFILSRTNIDQLIMPLLKILYHAQDKNSHHIYMALIILLILSEDDVFNKAVHEITLKNVPWFKERTMSEVSLGGLLILVVIRTIQFNIARMRDKYLHTNCLAALANMSSQFTNLHQYVSQKLVSLFSQLCKKHMKLVDQIRVAAMKEGQKPETAKPEKSKLEGATGTGSCTEDEEATQEDYMQDLAVLEEVIRMVLEIINSALTSQLHHNPNLVYTLLYQKDSFGLFRSHPTFQDIIVNIDTVMAYFSGKLEQVGGNPSPSEVLNVIQQGSRQFRRDRLKKFPDLKFKYVEEESPEEFFIPYIWSLVYHSSNLYFNATKIILFSLSS